MRRGRGSESGRRFGGSAGLTAALLLVGCSSPEVFDVQSRLSPRSSQACVVDELVHRGFRVTENNRRDGFVRAERPGRFWRFQLSDEWDIIEVFIYEPRQGDTVIQYMAGRLDVDEDGVDVRGPKGDVEEAARDIAYACS